MSITKRTVRSIRIHPDKCTGCRSCEVVCAAFHSEPPYVRINPMRSRIRVFRDEENDLFVPILAGTHSEVECLARHIIVINGKEYPECSFCRSSCPSRDLFKEPDAPDIPLKCDVCGEPPPEGGPLCVQWCYQEALTYEPERQEEVEAKDRDEEEEEIEIL